MGGICNGFCHPIYVAHMDQSAIITQTLVFRITGFVTMVGICHVLVGHLFGIFDRAWRLSNIGGICHEFFHPILEKRSTILLLLLLLLLICHSQGTPAWILKRAGLESSGQSLIFSICKTKRIAFI